MRRSLRWKFFVAPLLACLLQRGAPGQVPPTLGQIIDGIERTEKLFFESESFLIRYRRVKSEDVTPTRYSGAPLRAEWVLARRGDKWFTQRRFTHPTEDTKPGVHTPAEPAVVLTREGALLEWDQSARQASVDGLKQGGSLWINWHYTNNLSLSVFKYITQSTGANPVTIASDDLKRPFLPDFLRNNVARYRVKPEPEEIDGVRCWLVEWPDMDRFWVDPQHGFAIRRRAYCWGPGKPLHTGVLNRDYREAKPGLWLPYLQIVDRYADINAEDKAVWGKLACRTEMQLDSIEFDRLSDDFFAIRLPPGTIVFDVVRKLHYRVADPNGGDPFGEPVLEALQLQPARGRAMVTIAAILIPVGLIVLGYLLSRRHHVKRTSTP